MKNSLKNLFKSKISRSYDFEIGDRFLTNFRKKVADKNYGERNIEKSTTQFKFHWTYFVALSFSLVLIIGIQRNQQRIKVKKIAFSNVNNDDYQIIVHAEMLEQMELFDHYDKISQGKI